MTDLQSVLSYDDSLHQQLQDTLLLHRSQFIQPGPDSLAEGGPLLPGQLGRLPIRMEAGVVVALSVEGLAAILRLPAAFLQLFQSNKLGLVGVNQTDLLAFQPPELSVPFPPLCLRCRSPLVGPVGERLEVAGRCLGLIEQTSDVGPHGRVQTPGPQQRPGTPGLVGGAKGLPAAALVVAVRPTAVSRMRDPDHRPAAALAGE
jgi:hypothetical protein